MKQSPYQPVLWYFFFVLLLIYTASQGAPIYAASCSTAHNTIFLPLDSLPTASPDSITALRRDSTATLPISSGGIDKQVKYMATDSIVYDVKNKKIHLYTNAAIAQASTELSAARITIDQSSKIVQANYTTDSTGHISGKPMFVEGTHRFQSDALTYNLNTGRGKIQHIVAKEGEGYLQGEQVKKNARNEMFIQGAFYTTCGLEHPHFKIAINKVKLVPDKLIVSGPAQLVIEDVPTPLVLPFGIFPLQKGQRSGILIPSYGYSPTRGYYFQGGGYYFGFSDYLDLTLTGDIYTNLTWRINAITSYRKRYKYSGLLALDFARLNEEDRLSPSFSSSSTFLVSWNHSQDPKATRNGTFSADVRFGSNRVNQEFGLNNATVLSNSFTSGLGYQRNFAGTPFSLSVGARLDQNNNTRLVNLTFPLLNVNMSRINPFKRKMAAGKTRWYEKIGLQYNLDAQAKASLPDSILFGGRSWGSDVLQYGIKHTATLNTDFRLLKYLNFQPSINYSESWVWQTVDKEWIPYETYRDTIINGELTTDTIPPYLKTNTVKGFKRAMQFSTGLSMTTKLYGLLQFKRGKLKAIRHELTPTIGFSYRPDFGAPPFNYYKTVQNNINGKTTEYSIFERNIYGSPPNGAAAAINFSLQNNLQMKVFSKKDTSSKQEKKVVLLDRLSINGSYNFIDETGLKWSRITTEASKNLFNNRFTVLLRSTFDPYTLDSIGKRIPTTEWAQNRRLLRFESLSLNFPIAINSDMFRKGGTGQSSSSRAQIRTAGPQATNQQQRDLNDNPDDFVNFNIPWTLSVNYTFALNAQRLKTGRDTLLTTQTLNFKGDINLTPKWKIGFDSGYDFANKAISRTIINIYRDLHCWQMTFNIAPIGAYQHYMFTLQVKEQILQDLKLTRRRYWRDF